MKHNTGLKCPLEALCRLCGQPLRQYKEEAYVKKRVTRCAGLVGKEFREAQRRQMGFLLAQQNAHCMTQRLA
jgi:hypothetical protein